MSSLRYKMQVKLDFLEICLKEGCDFPEPQYDDEIENVGMLSVNLALLEHKNLPYKKPYK